MQIKFSPELILYTNGSTTVEVNGNTVGECIEGTFNRFPQLLVFLTSHKAAEAEKTSLKFNGEYIFEPASMWLSASDDDVLEFGRDIPEGEGSGLKVILGAAIIVAAIVSFQLEFIGSGVALMIGGMGASMMIGGLSEMIIGTPKLPSDPTSNTSPTYSFTGIQNTTAAGTPTSIVYGTHRVAGHIVNVYTQVLFDQNNYLFAQIALSEGEIEDIEDVEINSRLANEFQNTSLYWRQGTPTQGVPAKALTIEENETYAIELAAFRDYANRTVLFTSRGDLAGSYNTGGYDHKDKLILNELGAVFTQVSLSLTMEHDRSHLYSGQWYVWLEAQDGRLLTEKKSSNFGGDTSQVFTFDLNTEWVEGFVVKTSTVTRETYCGETWEGGEGGWLVSYCEVQEYWYGIMILTSVTMRDTQSAVRDKEAAMYGFNSVQNTTTYNLPITAQQDNYTAGGAWVPTRTAVGTVYLTIVAPALTANSRGATVEFKVGYRPATKMTQADYTYKFVTHKDNPVPDTFKISSAAGTTSEVYKGVVIDGLPVAMWEIVVWRVTEDHSGSLTIIDSIILKDVTEVLPGGHIYPHTALLGVRVKASEQISGGLPTITSLVKGIKVKLPAGYDGTSRRWAAGWDGTLTTTKAWTDNPVWCLYDLITNKRYGLGDYFKLSPAKAGLMLANFVEMANYCDERLNLDGSEGAIIVQTTVSGAKVLYKPVVTEEGTVLSDYEIPRPRFSLNIVLDESKSAIEWLNVICSCMRATLFYTEGCVFIDVDRPKPITQLFTMSSIAEYTQSQTSRSGVPNTYEVQFVDKDKGYKQTLLTVEDPAFQEDPTMEQRSKALALRGVTDERQARSLAKYTLYTGKLMRTVVSFKTGTQGLRSMVGDVIGVQHDVPRWGFGGKIVSCDTSNPSTYILTLSTEVEIVSGNEYKVCISSSDPTKLPETVDVFEEVGVSNTLSIVPPSFVPAKGDEFILGLTTNTVKPFKIASLKRDSDEKIEVVAVEYVEGLYAAADNITDTGAITASPYPQISEPSRLTVQNTTVNQKIYLDSVGVYKTGIVLTYTVPTDTYWTGVTLWYGLGAYSTALPINRDGYIFIPELAEPGLYQFAFVSHYSDGTRQTVQEAVNAGAIGTTLLDVSKPLAETFMTGISGLAIENQGNDSTFLGKDCKVTWHKPLVYNPDAQADTEIAGASTTQTNNLLAHYIVEVRDTVNDSIRRSTKILDERYTYTHEMNHEDSVIRTFAISVVAVDIYGRKSEPSTIVCSNPAPAAIS